MQNLKLLFASLLTLGTAAAADAPTTQSFAWLSGHWCSQTESELIEEYWLPPEGGLALGMSRTVKGGKVTSFEFMRIESDAGITAYVAQPQGRPPTAFRLTATGKDSARFENPQHDFPKRIEYRRVDGALTAQIAGPGDGGKELVISYNYRRCVD